ncbi:hypothetical protein [Streptomyces sp. NBC_01481]|uniref:hypothetical protein n=1 Tax=Streptomyces sp. NBC_01481 TaxID=2975869 RepID=UPI002252DBE3|nr:hypothetical protein [Streptomyces sp. NBC_01481]MCX4586480.1 hypothetical protein [Streptomyces sp. NBC_01481]
MTAAAARPAAVLRVLRRAAGGRRALRVMLFLGGLLTIGLLHGGQAHAAELPQPMTATGASAMAADAEANVATSVQQTPVRELRRVVRSVEPVREVAQPVVDTVRHVVRPVVHQLTEPLGGLPAQSLPEPPPVPLTPPGSDAGKVGTPQLLLARSAAVEAGGSSEAATVTTTGQLGSYDIGPDRPRVEARSAKPVSAPAQVPGGPCDSTPGALQQSAETHTPRTGDQHAATSAYDRPFALVPGAGGSAADAPTRERTRDILEFPG